MLLAETIKSLENQNTSNNFFKNTLFIAIATKSCIQMMSFQELFNKSQAIPGINYLPGVPVISLYANHIKSRFDSQVQTARVHACTRKHALPHTHTVCVMVMPQ